MTNTLFVAQWHTLPIATTILDRDFNEWLITKIDSDPKHFDLIYTLKCGNTTVQATHHLNSFAVQGGASINIIGVEYHKTTHKEAKKELLVASVSEYFKKRRDILDTQYFTGLVLIACFFIMSLHFYVGLVFALTIVWVLYITVRDARALKKQAMRWGIIHD